MTNGDTLKGYHIFLLHQVIKLVLIVLILMKHDTFILLQVIAAEGEQKVTILSHISGMPGFSKIDESNDQASTALKEAANVIQQSPQALQVARLSTILSNY